MHRMGCTGIAKRTPALSCPWARGVMVNISRKHKLNVGSSKASELVSITDVLGMMMWCKYFMEAQGYAIENNILSQDNKLTILLAKNGRMSAGKNSKHTKNKFS